jgi:hypothetical protein
MAFTYPNYNLQVSHSFNHKSKIERIKLDELTFAERLEIYRFDGNMIAVAPGVKHGIVTNGIRDVGIVRLNGNSSRFEGRYFWPTDSRVYQTYGNIAHVICSDAINTIGRYRDGRAFITQRENVTFVSDN